MSNLYYNPAESGYTIVGTADKCGGPEFNDFLVLEKDGRYFYATDAGCSCVSPFERMEEDELTEGTPQEILKAMADWAGTYLIAAQIDGYETIRSALMDVKVPAKAA